MGDRSAHDERGGSRPLARTRPGGPGEGCRGWGSSGVWFLAGEEVACRAAQNVISFILRIFCLFLLSGGTRGKEIREPCYDRPFRSGTGYGG